MHWWLTRQIVLHLLQRRKPRHWQDGWNSRLAQVTEAYPWVVDETSHQRKSNFEIKIRFVWVMLLWEDWIVCSETRSHFQIPFLESLKPEKPGCLILYPRLRPSQTWCSFAIFDISVVDSLTIGSVPHLQKIIVILRFSLLRNRCLLQTAKMTRWWWCGYCHRCMVSWCSKSTEHVRVLARRLFEV